jgi:translocation and assembly module TamB
MARAKSIAKWSLVGLGTLLGLALVVVGLAFAWLRSDGGLDWLARQIEDAASTPGEMELAIGSLRGDFPGSLRATDVVLRDGDGPWLTLSSLAVDWRPWQLLSETLDIERIALTGVSLSRLPAATSTDEAEESDTDLRGLLDFPLKVRLGRLTADEIDLGEPVLGQAARFTLSGEAGRREDGGLDGRLDLVRLDGPEERVLATLTYDPRSDTLSAEVFAAAAPGGLLAVLLDMPDLPASEMTLAGDGPLADWSGDITLKLGDLAEAEATLRLRRPDGGALAFSLQGAGSVSPPADSDLWSLAAGRTEIDLQGAWQEAGRLQIDRLAAANDQLRLELSGDFEPDSGALDLTLAAAADDGAALARLAGLDGLRALAAEVSVGGSITLPQATLDLTAEGLDSPDFAAETVTARGTVTAQRDLLGPAPLLNLDLQGDLTSPRLPGQDAVNEVLGDALPWRLAGSLDLGANRFEIAVLEAAAGPARLTASGPIDLNEGAGSIETRLEVSELAALQPLTEIALGGELMLTGPVTLERFGGRIDAELQGRWDRPASDIGVLAALAGQGLDLATRLTLDNGDLRLEELRATSPGTQLTVGMAIAGTGIRDGRYSLALADAAVLAGELGVDLAGPASVAGELSGPFDALALNGRAQVARLTVAEQQISDVSANYRLQISGADIDGPVNVALTSPFGPVEAETDLQLRAEALTLAALQAQLPGAALNGRVVVPLDGGEPRADLSGEIADLGHWLEVAGLSGGGQGRLTVKLNLPDAPAPLTADAEFTGLSFLPDGDATPLRAARLTASLRAPDTAFTQPARATLVAETLQWDDLTLDRLDAEATGTADDLEVSLATAGRWIEPLELTAAARIGRQEETLTVNLDRARGSAFGQPLELRRPATLTLAPTVTRLRDLAIASGDTALTAEAEFGDGRVSLQAALERLPMTTVDAFWDSGLAGQVSAEVNLEGSFDDPRGSASLAATGLRPRDDDGVPELQLTASADWRGGRLRAEGELGGAQVAAARFSADAPLQLSEEGGVVVPPEAPISGNFDWTGNISTLLLFVPLPQHRFDGPAEIAVALGGTAGAPAAEGHIALSNGRYENLETGTLLRDLNLRADLGDERLTLTRLTANDGSGGRIRGSGDVAIDPATRFPFDVSIDLDGFHAVRRDDMTAVTSGRLRLDGDLDSPRVEGRFTTDTVEISLLTDLPPNVVSLDVIEVINGVVQPQAEEEPAAGIDALLDIVIEMPRRVFVRGRGLDSEWAGRISVQGPAADPQVTGTLNLVRGQMSVVGKTFALREGRVTLPEGADTEPALDVTAVHEGPELTVTARLSGPLSQPVLDLSSVPEVPRDEIVSRVLFNKSAASLSAVEAAQLAIALRDLTGRGGGADILGFARQTLGVDVLRIETGEGEAPALEAGKYLTDEVYIGVRQGTTSQSSAAGIEVELTPNIKLESEVTGSGASKSGVRFQWNY